LVKKFDPTVVFGNEGEWDVVGGPPETLSVDAVIKRGRLGSTFVVGGVQTVLGAVPGPVVDVTGAGDALAAGISWAARRWRWRPWLAVSCARAPGGRPGGQPP
jgi:sugar/nucleoside kinase (ribokinase family)